MQLVAAYGHTASLYAEDNLLKWICVAGGGERLPRIETRVYILPKIQGNAARKGPLGSFILLSARFSHVHIDLVGPLPLSSGFRYCFTLIKIYIRWPEALHLSDNRRTVAKAFVSVWFARFGRPHQITTYQGRQFEARLFKTLATITGSSLTRTTAWHLASNSMVERLRCQLKAALMCHANEQCAEIYRRSCWKSVVHGRRT